MNDVCVAFLAEGIFGKQLGLGLDDLVLESVLSGFQSGAVTEADCSAVLRIDLAWSIVQEILLPVKVCWTLQDCRP